MSKGKNNKVRRGNKDENLSKEDRWILRTIKYPSMPVGNNVVAITAYDSSDSAASRAWWTTFGGEFVGEATLKEMVNKILKLTKNKRIGRLAIYDHGSTVAFEMGDQDIGITSFHRAHHHRKELVKLQGRFAVGGYIYLGNCYIGQGTDVIVNLAQLLKVKVYANTGLVRPGMNIAHGRLVCVFPNGEVTFPNQLTKGDPAVLERLKKRKR